MIKQIIPAITPSNITDIQLLKDALDIFLDYIEKNSNISEDIKNIFDQNKIPIYEEFVKIYLNNVYSVLSKTEHNEKLYNALKGLYGALGKDIDTIDTSIDIIGLLTEDYIITNKDYKSAKGTPKAMEYIYNIVINSGVQRDFLEDNTGNFRYYENGNLFEYNIEGTMMSEVYEQFVKPLAHPVGWAYFYQRIFYLNFIDYFDLKFVYTVRSMEVRCMNGDIYSKDDYATNISHDGSQLVQNNVPEFIYTQYVGEIHNKSKLVTVIFESGEKIISNQFPRSLILYNADGTEKINYDDFDGNCGFYLDYDVKTETTVNDNIDFHWTSQFASTTGKKNDIGAGNVFIGNFIIGDELVNKDTPVTYQSIIGKFGGTYATPSLNEGLPPEYWDLTSYRLDDYNFIFDAGLPPRAIDSSVDEKDGITYPRWDETNEVARYDVGGYSGNTADDEYDWEQVLKIIPHQEFGFDEPFGDQKYWDNYELKFDNFTFDSEYVAEEFSIIYGCNTFDTDIRWDYFVFDAKYISGGFNDAEVITEELNTLCPQYFTHINIT